MAHPDWFGREPRTAWFIASGEDGQQHVFEGLLRAADYNQCFALMSQHRGKANLRKLGKLREGFSQARGGWWSLPRQRVYRVWSSVRGESVVDRTFLFMTRVEAETTLILNALSRGSPQDSAIYFSELWSRDIQ